MIRGFALLAVLTATGAMADDLGGPAKVKDVVAQCADTVKEADRERLGCSAVLLTARTNAAMMGAAALCEPDSLELERSALVRWLAARPDLQETDGVTGLRMGLSALYSCR